MSADQKKQRILIVEDSDAKFGRLQALIGPVAQSINGVCERAATLTEAETRIDTGVWSLVVLDISLDIAKTTAGPKLGGHATLGGLNVATKMFLLEREVPTIIVTAFDMFQETGVELAGYNSLGLEDIKRRASEMLGGAFLGCIRYGEPGWEDTLMALVREIIR
jgi:CheY-like chemotaxis protein